MKKKTTQTPQPPQTDIKFIRLSNGEDIISQVVETIDKNKNQHFLLIRPLKIVYMATPVGTQTRIALTVIPWVYPSVSTIQEFEIYVNDILTIANPSQTLIKFYDNYWSNDEEYESEAVSDVEFDKMSDGDVLKTIKNTLAGSNTKVTIH
jgi:hypothetical protein